MASSNPSWPMLPLELVESIFYKVPVASLVRFKSTCKQWYALLNDKKFIYKYLELSREGLIRVSDHNLLQFINLETLALSNIQGPSDIYTVIHCDGLLLCVFIMMGITKLAVWNPFLSQIKWIKPSSSYTGFDIYGFGYDNVSRDNYKILRFKREKGYEEVEIYEFTSQLWRSVDYSLAYSWHPWFNEARSMNGNMYWIAEMVDDNSVDSPFDTRTFFIQCFDFSKEVFKETCGLPFVKRDAWLLPRLSGFGGDRLSLLAQHKNGKIQVWVTNNLSDEVVSWSMYFDVTPDNFRILTGSPTYLVHKTNRIMLWCEEEDVENINIYVNVYEIGEGFVEKQVETGRRRRCDKVYKHSRCFVFVPSLVPVPK